MKYIIEIEDEPYFSGGKTVYRMGGAHVYFSEGQFEKLTPYVESDTAEQAWKIAQDILKDSGKDGMSNEELNDCFGTDYIYLIGTMSYAEVKAKYDAWQEKKAKIKVGDEVKNLVHPDSLMIVTRINCDNVTFDGIRKGGVAFHAASIESWRKTGRTFPEVAELLEKMRNPDADH